MSLEFWERVIWGDKSKFNVWGSDWRRIVWRKPGTEMNLKHPRSTVKHGGESVMVWGFMTKRVEVIAFIWCNMNRFVYLDILKQLRRSSAEKLLLEPNCIICFSTWQWPKTIIIYYCSIPLIASHKQLYTLPQSLDLNPIMYLYELLARSKITT